MIGKQPSVQYIDLLLTPESIIVLSSLIDHRAQKHLPTEDRGFLGFSHIFNEILQYIEIWNEFKVGNHCAYFSKIIKIKNSLKTALYLAMRSDTVFFRKRSIRIRIRKTIANGFIKHERI